MFLDGEKVGTEALPSGSYPNKTNQLSTYDIGLKRDNSAAIRGYLRDLMVVGRALIGEELINITGKSKYLFSLFSLISCIAKKHEQQTNS